MSQTVRGKIPRGNWHNTQHLNAWKAQMRRQFDNFTSSTAFGFLFYSYEVPSTWNKEDIEMAEVRVHDTAAKTLKCKECKKTRSIIYYDPYYDERLKYHLPEICSTCRGRPILDLDLLPKRGFFDAAPSEERIIALGKRYEQIRKKHGRDDDYGWTESLFDDELFDESLPEKCHENSYRDMFFDGLLVEKNIRQQAPLMDYAAGRKKPLDEDLIVPPIQDDTGQPQTARFD